jgi:hypothetical protein
MREWHRERNIYIYIGGSLQRLGEKEEVDFMAKITARKQTWGPR